MTNTYKAILGINWKLLQKQKEYLAFMVIEDKDQFTHNEHKALEGILSMIDAIQEAVVADNLVSESQVFTEENLEGWNEFDTTTDCDKENDITAEELIKGLEAIPVAAIEPVCDSTVQVQSAIELVEGRKYNILSLTEEDAFSDNLNDLKNLTFVRHTIGLSYFTGHKSLVEGKEIGLLCPFTFEEIKEEPTEVNLFGKVDTDETLEA